MWVLLQCVFPDDNNWSSGGWFRKEEKEMVGMGGMGGGGMGGMDY